MLAREIVGADGEMRLGQAVVGDDELIQTQAATMDLLEVPQRSVEQRDGDAIVARGELAAGAIEIGSQRRIHTGQPVHDGLGDPRLEAELGVGRDFFERRASARGQRRSGDEREQASLCSRQSGLP